MPWLLPFVMERCHKIGCPYHFHSLTKERIVDCRFGPEHRLDGTLVVQFIIKLLARFRGGQGMIKSERAQACINTIGGGYYSRDGSRCL